MVFAFPDNPSVEYSKWLYFASQTNGKLKKCALSDTEMGSHLVLDSNKPAARTEAWFGLPRLKCVGQFVKSFSKIATGQVYILKAGLTWRKNLQIILNNILHRDYVLLWSLEGFLMPPAQVHIWQIWYILITWYMIGGIRRAAFFCQTAVVFPLPPLPHPTHLPAGHKKINMQIFPIFWKPLRVQHETYTCWEGCIKNRFSGQKAWRCATRSTENLSFWCPVMMVITHLQQCHSFTTALSVFICQIHINIYVYMHVVTFSENFAFIWLFVRVALIK